MAGQDVCSACHAPVRRVITEGAKIRDLEPTPREDGNHIVVVRGDGTVRTRVLTGTEMPAQQEAFKAHQCPPKEPPGPACAACLLPMNAELTRLERWSFHPCCDPNPARQWAREQSRRRSA